MAKKKRKKNQKVLTFRKIDYSIPNIYDLVRCDTQEKTIDYVKRVLKLNEIPFQEDISGNIFYLDNENVPLLSAHMDTVARDADRELAVRLKEDDTGIITTGGICGGDDKNGVYIILAILVEKKLKVNFIFSTDEEIGCLGIKALLKDENNVNKIKENSLYSLVLDRKGDSDIICYNNEYGSKEFEERLKEVSSNHGFGYKPATGTYSDADYISDYISTANLSVGYYNPHSSSEYIDINAMLLAQYFIELIILEVKDKYEPVEKLYKNFHHDYNYYDYYGEYYGGGYYDEYEMFRKKQPSHLSNLMDTDEAFDKLFEEEYSKFLEENYTRCFSCGEFFEDDDIVKLQTGWGMPLELCVHCGFEVKEYLDIELEGKVLI